MKTIILFACSFLIISCNQPNNKSANHDDIRVFKDKYLVNEFFGTSHEFEICNIINDYDSITITPQNNSDTIRLERKGNKIILTPENFKKETYIYSVNLFNGLHKTSITDSFRLVRPDLVLNNSQMNFLIYNKENPFDFSSNSFPYELCRLQTKDSATIKKFPRGHYSIFPKRMGKIKIEIECLINGKYEPIAYMTYNVIDGTERVNDLINMK